MKRLLIAAAVCAAFSAQAVEVPQGSKFDGRIKYVSYNSGDVVSVNAYPGLGIQIVFAPHEKILDIASGFTQGWEFMDRRNILYVKPKSIRSGETLFEPEAGKWDTNLLVTTSVRMYAFDLHLLSMAGSKATQQRNASYRVQFSYPEDEAAEARRKETLKRVDEGRKQPPVNWNYTMQAGKNSDSIAPSMAWDDGRFTYLRFPNNRDFPAAFLVGGDKAESIVNSHLESTKPGGAKDILVIHRVARELVLRFGDSVVGVYNESFDPDGLPTDTGATVPGVERTMRYPEAAQ
jgi:type IV secretion system protein VirB9